MGDCGPMVLDALSLSLSLYIYIYIYIYQNELDPTLAFRRYSGWDFEGAHNVLSLG